MTKTEIRKKKRRR